MAEVSDVEERQQKLLRLADQVTRSIADARCLWPSVAGLVADEGCSHEAYLGGTGPSVRASIFDDIQDTYNSRFT